MMIRIFFYYKFVSSIINSKKQQIYSLTCDLPGNSTTYLICVCYLRTSVKIKILFSFIGFSAKYSLNVIKTHQMLEFLLGGLSHDRHHYSLGWQSNKGEIKWISYAN